MNSSLHTINLTSQSDSIESPWTTANKTISGPWTTLCGDPIEGTSKYKNKGQTCYHLYLTGLKHE